jgi:hypothetical protein
MICACLRSIDGKRTGPTMMKIATLGPAGTNHEFVTREYLRFHDVQNAEVVLLSSFVEAIEGLLAGRYDFVIQCAVHPAAPATLGGHFKEVFAVDCFISQSRDLAILTRTEVKTPRSIGLLRPATESYANLDVWERKIAGPSLPILFENLLKGHYDSALVYLDYAAEFPDRVRVDKIVGSPDDVWIVYACERTSRGMLQAWKNGPVRDLIRRKSATPPSVQS